jgi:hypothetical protein
MTSLSVLLAEIETSTDKIKTLETELAAEKDKGKSLVERYRSQSADALKTLGIADASCKERKPRSHQSVLISVANRSVRQTIQGGENFGARENFPGSARLKLPKWRTGLRWVARSSSTPQACAATR